MCCAVEEAAVEEACVEWACFPALFLAGPPLLSLILKDFASGPRVMAWPAVVQVQDGDVFRGRAGCGCGTQMVSHRTRWEQDIRSAVESHLLHKSMRGPCRAWGAGRAVPHHSVPLPLPHTFCGAALPVEGGNGGGAVCPRVGPARGLRWHQVSGLRASSVNFWDLVRAIPLRPPCALLGGPGRPLRCPGSPGEGPPPSPGEAGLPGPPGDPPPFPSFCFCRCESGFSEM